MIYNMMRDIQKAFVARKYPTPFKYSPERTKRELFDTAIVMGRDTGANDATLPAEGSKGHAAGMVGVRQLAAFAKFYVNSTLEGADTHDHEESCEVLIDAFQVELFRWAKLNRRGAIPIVEARYLTTLELETEICAGVVYLLRFRVGRGLYVRDYNAASPLTNAPAGVHTNEIDISSNGQGREVITLPE